MSKGQGGYEAGKRDGHAVEEGTGRYDQTRVGDPDYRRGMSDGRSEHIDNQLRKGR